MLEKNKDILKLSLEDHPELNPIYVDFLNGPLAHRRKHGGGKNQLIAKAVGLHKHPVNLLDISAGLARDAFILACLGANVIALERNPTIAALVKDAIERARTKTWFCELKFEFIEINARDYLLQHEGVDVIYFDPMFPERSKSALVKKEMRMLRDIVGDDEDADEIFKLALSKAKKRVVVKRPKLAPDINNQKPNFSYEGKSSRFDIYLV